MRIMSFLFLFIAIKSIGQSIKPHGTQIIAAICDEGIIVAADSRSAFKKYYQNLNEEFCYAYIDSFKKVFKFGRYQIAITGQSNPTEDSWEKILTKYNKRKNEDTLIESAFDKFINYLNKELKINDTMIYKSGFFICGFENNKPVILAVSSSGRVRAGKVFHRIMSDNCGQMTLRQTPGTSCSDFIVTIKKAFEECSANDVTIGGPIHIIRINRDNSVVVLNSFKFLPNETNKQVNGMILEGKLDVKYLYPESEDFLKKLLLRESEKH